MASTTLIKDANGNNVPAPSTGGGSAVSLYTAGDGRTIQPMSTLGILFSDDFGGSALDTVNRWDVLDGGLPANPTLDGQSLVQAAIGTGINMGNGHNDGTNSALTVSASTVAITMPTTTNAEFWLLSKQIFSCTEDVSFVYTVSQAIVANSVRIGLVEVDPVTGIPLVNPNLANNFTNAGGVELSAFANAVTAGCWAIADSSPVEVVPAQTTSWTTANKATLNECLVEFHAEDIIASASIPDVANARSGNVARVSSQVPNDGKAYKLIVRLRNIGTPASPTTVVLYRMLVVDGQEMRVEVASGRGDNNAQKGIAVNIPGGLPTGSSYIGWTNATTGYNDTTTALGSGATFTGTSHIANSAANAGWSYFGACAWADVTGTLNIQQTIDNGVSWQTVASSACPAGGAVDLTVRIRGNIGGANAGYRVTFVNGGTAQATFRLSSSFTAN